MLQVSAQQVEQRHGNRFNGFLNYFLELCTMQLRHDTATRRALLSSATICGGKWLCNAACAQTHCASAAAR